MVQKSERKYVTTLELIEALKQPNVVMIEVVNHIGNFIRATHTMYYENGVIFDTGIDDEEIEWSEPAFIKTCADRLWSIDYIEHGAEVLPCQ